MKSEMKFIRKGIMDSLEKWEIKLNQEGKLGWKVIQIFTTPNGDLAALLRKDE